MNEEKFIGKWTEKFYKSSSYSFMNQNKGIYETYGKTSRKIDFTWHIYYEYEFKLNDEIIHLEHSDKYDGIIVIEYRKYMTMIFYYRFSNNSNVLYFNDDNELDYETELIFTR